MEIGNLLRGALYPSTRVSRCPRFSRCTMCQKCQNFDRHNLECNHCENRLRIYEDNRVKRQLLCEHIPEGEFFPDLQDCKKEIESYLKKPAVHPDQKGQSVGGVEITRKMERIRKATEIMHAFLGKPKISEEVVRVWIDSGEADKIGRDVLGRLE